MTLKMLSVRGVYMIANHVVASGEGGWAIVNKLL